MFFQKDETNVPNGDVPDTLNCVPDPSFNFVFDEPEPTLMKEAAEFSLLEPSLRPSLPNKELLPEGGGASNITNEGDEVNEVKDSTDPNTVSHFVYLYFLLLWYRICYPI